MTVVCGDSHTATHGAFGALAFGIGTSEVEHVLASQCLLQRPSKTFRSSRRRFAESRRDREGHHSQPDRENRHRRRHGLRDRILRLGDSRAVDGRAHDRLQHVDRRRREGGLDRSGRQDVRIRRGPAVRAEGRRLGRRGRALANAADGRRRDLRSRNLDRCQRARTDDHVRNESGNGHRHLAIRARSRQYRGSHGARDARKGAALYGFAGRQIAGGASGERGVHRKLHQFAHFGFASGGGAAQGPQSELRTFA